MSRCCRRSAICFIYLSFSLGLVHTSVQFLYVLRVAHCIVLLSLLKVKKVFAKGHELWGIRCRYFSDSTFALYIRCVLHYCHTITSL